jgi:conjugative relaxase-like TrwC/TraI family protein
MAWMRMMGVDSVAYHRTTVMDRADDHPGAALGHYTERGETPMVWGGGGSIRLDLRGPVTAEQYEAIFGPGGARDPATGRRLASTKRPGLELGVAAHKSVAEVGVIGRVDDMHRILDAETAGTIDYLDQVTRDLGGRRGRAAARTPTTGMLYAVTRHATSRAGDPNPHDHVLIANVVEMLGERGGFKAADTALWR